MADLYVCRATYTRRKDNGGFNNGSAIYAFETNGFSKAESLAYDKVRKEADYYANAKVTSIKRKNMSELDKVSCGSGEYLYRVSISHLQITGQDKYVNVTFVYPIAEEPADITLQQVVDAVTTHLSDKGYTYVTGATNASSAKFSYELSRKKLSADE